MAAHTLKHPTIGEVNGKSSSDSIIQFLGLQYATLKDRFAPPEIKKYSGNDTVDGTKLGPQVVTYGPGPDGEHILLQHTLDYERSVHYISDLEGLNLNVSVPKGSSTDAKLPVFTFIHGGGFGVGSSTFPQYDMTRLVELSVEQGMPIVAVSLNYRLSAPGFLTSEDMRAAGYKPNNAFRDQRTALLWIQKHISGFGGDPANVTLMGESAGGVSVSYLLHSQQPLFKRCMLMSGSFLLMPPAQLQIAEANYNNFIKTLGLETATPEDRVQALLSMDGRDLCTTCLKIGVRNLPIIDNDTVSFSPTFENVTSGKLDIPGSNWCEAALIGDCQFDGNIQGLRLMQRKKGIGAAFCSSITESLGNSVASRLLASYSLSPDQADDEAFFHVLEVCTDLNFFAPTLAFAENLSRDMPVYIYRFNEPNPWEGTWKGHATHIQDLTWLLQNFNQFLEGPQKQQARWFAEDAIKFVNGKECWTPWSKEDRKALAIGPGGKFDVVKDEAPWNGRRTVIHDLAKEVGMDKVNDALNVFMRGG